MNYNQLDEIDYFTNITNKKSVNYSPNNQKLELFNPYEGYLNGNLFKNLYNPYKGLKPQTIAINNERDELLLNIAEISFLRHELNLLLDNYPDNNEAISWFNKYKDMEAEQIENYERRYGPLTITGNINNQSPFEWENTIWPWEL